MKKFFAVVPLIVTLFAVGAIRSQAAVVDKIVAVVNNEIVTLSELNTQAEPFQERIDKSYTGKDKNRLLEETRKTILNRMVDQILIKQEAKRLGIVIKDDEINSMVTEMLKKRSMTMDEFKNLLARDGLSLESYKEEAREHLMRSRLANREIRSKVMVTEQEIGEYYKVHREEYEGRVAVKIRQIVLLCPSNAAVEKKREVRAEMEFILARIKNGEDFADLAAKYSPGIGGELGFVEKGAMLQPVEEEAFSLKVGAMSGIIESPAGYHIIQVLDKRGAGIKSFESVRAEIIEELTKEKTEKKFEEWIGELRKKSYVEIRI
jgi:parvulin-like peptidyl-prolyl isomerase